MCILTSSSTSVLESTRSHSTLTKPIAYTDQIYERNGSSSTPYLPRCDIKTIEVVFPDVGDISSG